MNIRLTQNRPAVKRVPVWEYVVKCIEPHLLPIFLAPSEDTFPIITSHETINLSTVEALGLISLFQVGAVV